MSLFQCDKCGAIENTALTFGHIGWSQKAGMFADARIERGLKVGGKYCSECFDGKWHGEFPKEIIPLGSVETDSYGNIAPKN